MKVLLLFAKSRADLGPYPVHPCTPLTHLDTKDASAAPSRFPPSRAPPQTGWFWSTALLDSYQRLRPRWARQGNASP